MSAPIIKGWCPGAHRPMMSGDGLVVRVRPFYGELSRDQVMGLCALAERFGNGVLDLTSRANIQIRGVAPEAFDSLLTELDALGLIDPDASVESHRNILVQPNWTRGDLTFRLYERLLRTLPLLPPLPEKIGFAIDTGARACLSEGSADFRFELDPAGRLLLRADGCTKGKPITESTAMDAMLELARWFEQSGGASHRRMARHLQNTSLPSGWAEVTPRSQNRPVDLGVSDQGTYLGAPFGKIAVDDLRGLFQDGSAGRLRLMPGRMIFLPDVQLSKPQGFESAPSRLMQVHACPGAPYCPQATIETLSVARTLARLTKGSLHVSGCAKGCAFPRSARTTLVGRDGHFDLVSDGQPWDEPRQRGLDPARVREMVEEI